MKSTRPAIVIQHGDERSVGATTQVYRYPFPPEAVALWRQWVRDSAYTAHGMDPDFILPFLRIDPMASEARLVMSVKNAFCELALVILPERSGVMRSGHWVAFQHDHIDVYGFTDRQESVSADHFFNLAANGLAREGKKLRRLSLPRLQYVPRGHHPGTALCKDSNAYFRVAGIGPYQQPAKLARNNRRLGKKLAEGFGAVALAVESSNFRNLGRFFEIEASGWKGAGGTAIEQQDELGRAYISACRHEDSVSRGCVFTLYAGSIPISAAFGLVYPGHVTLLKIAFDNRFGEFSPGSLLLSEILDYCIAENKNRLYLSTFPDWSHRWKPEAVDKFSVRLYADSAAGRVKLTLDALFDRVARFSRGLLSRLK
jgi:CelD/BcsL family acetyltransferase involved in cellulose biosynthesis